MLICHSHLISITVIWETVTNLIWLSMKTKLLMHRKGQRTWVKTDPSHHKKTVTSDTRRKNSWCSPKCLKCPSRANLMFILKWTPSSPSKSNKVKWECMYETKTRVRWKSQKNHFKTPHRVNSSSKLKKLRCQAVPTVWQTSQAAQLRLVDTTRTRKRVSGITKGSLLTTMC